MVCTCMKKLPKFFWQFFIKSPDARQMINYVLILFNAFLNSLLPIVVAAFFLVKN